MLMVSMVRRVRLAPRVLLAHRDLPVRRVFPVWTVRTVSMERRVLKALPVLLARRDPLEQMEHRVPPVLLAVTALMEHKVRSARKALPELTV